MNQGAEHRYYTGKLWANSQDKRQMIAHSLSPVKNVSDQVKLQFEPNEDARDHCSCDAT